MVVLIAYTERVAASRAHDDSIVYTFAVNKQQKQRQIPFLKLGFSFSFRCSVLSLTSTQYKIVRHTTPARRSKEFTRQHHTFQLKPSMGRGDVNKR